MNLETQKALSPQDPKQEGPETLPQEAKPPLGHGRSFTARGSSQSLYQDLANIESLGVVLVEPDQKVAQRIQQLAQGLPALKLVFANFYSLPEAILYLERAEADLILANLSHPAGSELKWLARFLAVAPGVPVILLAEAAAEPVAKAALASGAQDYLLPGRLDADIFSRAVRYSLERGRLVQSLKRKAAEVRIHEVQFHSIVERNADGVMIIDQVGLVRYANPSAAAILGRPREKLVGRPLGAPVAEGRPAETTIHRPGQPPVVAELHSVAFAWEGKPAFLVTLRDVTFRRATEVELEMRNQQLRQAQKMEAIGNLAGGMAHDLNNVLTIVMGLCENLLSGEGCPEGVRSKVEQIRQSGNRAADLVRQLLAFGRKQVLHPEPLDLNVVSGEAIALLRRLIRDDVLIEWEAADTPCPVKADRTQLHQVLLNLAVNAQDALPGGGRLVIRTCRVALDRKLAGRYPGLLPGSYAQLSVRDNGTGMSAEVRERIFEPFFTTKPKSKGTGLGLATVYGIIKQSEGWIYVESEPGRGTEFHIFLPLLDGIAPATAPHPVPPVAVPADGARTILLVEDEAPIRDLYQDFLTELGYTVLTARNGLEALKASAEHQGKLDLMLSDVIMPEMSGAELGRKMAQLRPEMRMIFMSGYADEALPVGSRLTAGAHYLSKPFTPTQLSARIQEVLGGGEAGVLSVRRRLA